MALTVAAVARLGPLTRLANYRSDGPGPIYDQPGVDDGILQRAASLLPRGATYGVFGEPAFDLQGGAMLYFPPALQVPNVRAQWVLSYHAPQLLPSGLRSLSVHRVAKGVFLIRVEPT